MNRKELVTAYIELMGADAEEQGFYEELALLTDAEIVQKIIEVAQYYQNEYNSL